MKAKRGMVALLEKTGTITDSRFGRTASVDYYIARVTGVSRDGVAKKFAIPQKGLSEDYEREETIENRDIRVIGLTDAVDWADAERIALRHQGTDPETWSRKWRSAEEAIEALKAVKK